MAVASLSIASAIACTPETRDAGTASSVSGGSASTAVPGTVRDPIPDVSDLEALEFSADPAGEPMSFTAPDGQLRLVYFGYLSCPDICPLTMADAAAALNKLEPDEAFRVTPAFVTLDPERDTADRMVEYMEHFFPDHPYLVMQAPDTGALNQLAYNFHVQYTIPVHEEGEFYAIAHSGTLYVVDDNGLVVREFPFGTKADALAAGLRAELEALDAG